MRSSFAAGGVGRGQEDGRERPRRLARACARFYRPGDESRPSSPPQPPSPSFSHPPRHSQPRGCFQAHFPGYGRGWRAVTRSRWRADDFPVMRFRCGSVTTRGPLAPLSLPLPLSHTPPATASPGGGSRPTGPAGRSIFPVPRTIVAWLAIP